MNPPTELPSLVAGRVVYLGSSMSIFEWYNGISISVSGILS